MGIFRSIFHARDKPQNATNGSNYRFMLGGSTAGKAVTERSAMQMTAVYACVRILSEAIAGLPLHLYHYMDDGGKEKALDHPLYLLRIVDESLVVGPHCKMEVERLCRQRHVQEGVAVNYCFF